MLPLISVVVPVYNVESYLRKCLDSIIEQTYENLQIIVVDDGSTDSSGSICDEYEQSDERTTVMHVDNCGLSGARNTGMTRASGEYVVFVDSDDYLGANHIENLYKAIQACPDAKLAITGYTEFVDGSGEKLPNHSSPKYVRELSSSEAIKIGISPLGNKEFGEYAWGKLYHKELFNYLSYPLGKHYEDRYVFYKVAHIAGVIAYEDADDYFYLRKRVDSITNVVSEKNFDCIEATRIMSPYIREHVPEAYDDVRRRYAGELINGFSLACKIGSEERKNEFFSEMKSIRAEVLHDPSMPLSTKIGYLVSYLGKNPLFAATALNEKLFLEQ